MKKSLKRLLCLVLSVLLFTMSLPVLAADTTEETTTETEENTTTETNLPGLDLLENLKPSENNSNYNYVIVAKKPNKAKKELTWDDFKKALDNGEVGMSDKILLKTDVNLNEGFTFETTEGSGEVIISWRNYSVKVGVDGKVEASGWWADYIKQTYQQEINLWTPIGTENAPFQGVFNAFEYDENGNIIGMYDISGLMFNADTDNVGLFGVVDTGAIIAGVRVINSYVRGTNDVGAIVGHSKHGANIIGCVNGTGSVVIGTKNVGGVVGSFDVEHTAQPDLESTNQDHIYECVNRGYVYGETNVGGIVGYTYNALIRASYNVHANTNASEGTHNTKYTGHVYGTKYVGGIVGRAVSTVIHGCTNYGVVGYDPTDENNNTISAQYVGGIVGQLDMKLSYLREVVNASSATVTGTEYVGGIVGYLGETENSTIENSLELFMAYNHGTVNGKDKVGGLVGYNATRGKVFNSYSSGPVLIPNKDTKTNGNLVGFNAGEVRDCFYYPNMYAKEIENAEGVLVSNEKYNADYKDTVIGNGIGSTSTSGNVFHVSGLKVIALGTEAAAYLLNLVYLGDTEDVQTNGYHHLASHKFEDSAWTIPTYWMAGKYGPEFTESTSLAAKTIKSAQLFLNENFNLTFKVYVPNGLSTKVIKSRQVTVYQESKELKIGGEIKTDYIEQKDAEGNITGYYYEFTLTGIKPHYLGDKFEVIFTAKYAIPQIQDDGTAKELTENDYISVSEKCEYSVQDYCERQLAKKPTELGYTGEDDERYIRLKTLLCNVLEYGAVYQKYRNHANASGTFPNVNFEKNGWKATHYLDVDGTKPNGNITYKLNTTKNEEFCLYASMIRFGSENMLGVWIYIENIDNYNKNAVIVKVDNKEFKISDLQNHTSSPKVYKLAAIPVSITNIEKEYTFDLYPDIEQDYTESITFSMEAFIASLINNPDGRQDIAAALWDYYCAAKDYANGDKVDAPDDTTGDITLGDNIWDKDVWENIKDESNKGTNIDADGDGIPDSWVKLNISSTAGFVLSLFNSWLRELFTLELIQYQDAWYARPSDFDWSQWDTNA